MWYIGILMFWYLIPFGLVLSKSFRKKFFEEFYL